MRTSLFLFKYPIISVIEKCLVSKYECILENITHFLKFHRFYCDLYNSEFILDTITSLLTQFYRTVRYTILDLIVLNMCRLNLTLNLLVWINLIKHRH